MFHIKSRFSFANFIIRLKSVQIDFLINKSIFDLPSCLIEALFCWWVQDTFISWFIILYNKLLERLFRRRLISWSIAVYCCSLCWWGKVSTLILIWIDFRIIPSLNVLSLLKTVIVSSFAWRGVIRLNPILDIIIFRRASPTQSDLGLKFPQLSNKSFIWMDLY